jgi:hypothetical protein
MTQTVARPASPSERPWCNYVSFDTKFDRLAGTFVLGVPGPGQRLEDRCRIFTRIAFPTLVVHEPCAAFCLQGSLSVPFARIEPATAPLIIVEIEHESSASQKHYEVSCELDRNTRIIRMMRYTHWRGKTSFVVHGVITLSDGERRQLERKVTLEIREPPRSPRMDEAWEIASRQAVSELDDGGGDEHADEHEELSLTSSRHALSTQSDGAVPEREPRPAMLTPTITHPWCSYSDLDVLNAKLFSDGPSPLLEVDLPVLSVYEPGHVHVRLLLSFGHLAPLDRQVELKDDIECTPPTRRFTPFREFWMPKSFRPVILRKFTPSKTGFVVSGEVNLYLDGTSARQLRLTRKVTVNVVPQSPKTRDEPSEAVHGARVVESPKATPKPSKVTWCNFDAFGELRGTLVEGPGTNTIVVECPTLVVHQTRIASSLSATLKVYVNEGSPIDGTFHIEKRAGTKKERYDLTCEFPAHWSHLRMLDTNAKRRKETISLKARLALCHGDLEARGEIKILVSRTPRPEEHEEQEDEALQAPLPESPRRSSSPASSRGPSSAPPSVPLQPTPPSAVLAPAPKQLEVRATAPEPLPPAHGPKRKEAPSTAPEKSARPRLSMPDVESTKDLSTEVRTLLEAHAVRACAEDVHIRSRLAVIKGKLSQSEYLPPLVLAALITEYEKLETWLIGRHAEAREYARAEDETEDVRG